MITPTKFCVMFRSGIPDQQLLSQAMRAWLTAERQKDPTLIPSPDGQTQFEVVRHLFSTSSDAEFEDCVRNNAEYIFRRSPDTMFFYKGVVLWPSDG